MAIDGVLKLFAGPSLVGTALLWGIIASPTFSVLGGNAWKLWNREEGTSLGWVLSQPVPNLGVTCNPMKTCCTTLTDVCKGCRSRLSLAAVLSKPFSLSVEIWILKCSAEGCFYLVCSKGKQKGLDFIWMSNFRAQNQEASQHEILMWHGSLQDK